MAAVPKPLVNQAGGSFNWVEGAPPKGVDLSTAADPETGAMPGPGFLFRSMKELETFFDANVSTEAIVVYGENVAPDSAGRAEVGLITVDGVAPTTRELAILRNNLAARARGKRRDHRLATAWAKANAAS
jgi:hypothetical protein